MNRSSIRAARRQRGISLIEIMVGLTVGMILVAGLSLMFANASRSNSEMDKSVQHIENGRYAMDLLAQEISLAGFYATVPTRTPSAALGACTGTAAFETALTTFAGAGTVPPGIQGLTAAEAAALTCLDNYKPLTPALVIRRLDTARIVPGTTATQSGALYVQASHNFADIGNVTYLGAASYIAKLGTGTTGGDATRFNLREIIATNLAPIRRVISRIYYIASCNICSGASTDTIPTLKMVEMTAAGFTTFALAEGIDRIGFDFGIDNSNDGAPDYWYGLNDETGGSAAATHMAATVGWGNVVSVRVNLVSRTTTPSTGWTDPSTYPIGNASCSTGATPTCSTLVYGPATTELAFKRRGYSNTIRLQSWAGQRET